MHGAMPGGIVEVPPKEAAEMVAAEQAILLDVREQQEWINARIDGAIHIPMMQVPDRVGELDKEATIIVQCHSGQRSLQVARFLRTQGFADVMNLHGGIVAWHQNGLPIEQG